MILAPGGSIKHNNNKIISEIDASTCVIAVNYIPEEENLKPDLVFLTNTKRYDAIKKKINDVGLIITSNLLRDVKEYRYSIAYNELVYFNGKYCDDSTLMLLNLLRKIGVSKVKLAGFDGRQNGKLNFVDSRLTSNKTEWMRNNQIKEILDKVFSDLDKVFITESQYQ